VATQVNSIQFGDYSLQRLTHLHYPYIQQLYFNAFGFQPSIQEIAKRFDTIRLGSEVIGYIAIHQPTDTPAAYYGVFPLKVLIQNNIIQAAQSGDTMTHSNHRKKGFFKKLARLTYEECKQKGIKIIIGQPNEKSYHGLVKSLEWTHLDEIIRWDQKLNFKTFPFPKLARHARVLQKLYLSYARFILKKYIVNDISSFNNTIPQNHGKIFRNKDYLEYKRSVDKFFLDLDGIIIWVRLIDVFWIGDISNYENIPPLFLQKLKKLSFLLGYNTISLNLNESISLPPPLDSFKKNSKQASCFLYLDKEFDGLNFILTAADSDTW